MLKANWKMCWTGQCNRWLLHNNYNSTTLQKSSIYFTVMIEITSYHKEYRILERVMLVFSYNKGSSQIITLMEYFATKLTFIIIIIFSQTAVRFTAKYFIKIIECFRWFFNHHPLIWGSVLLYLQSPKTCCCSISDDLSSSLRARRSKTTYASFMVK